MGLLYLDGPYSKLGALSAIAAFVNPVADPPQFQQRRQILSTLAVQAAGALTSARLMQRELERERVKQELEIARGIQQALLPKSFKELAHLQVTGINRPSLSVGGDYFDLIELGPERTAFVIADASAGRVLAPHW
jgi:serine phosphatase RsbU (regulator of sigma subunit)